MRQILALLVLSIATFAPHTFSQDQPQPPPAGETKQPEVHVTYLNVCTPQDDEKKLLTDTLARIPAQPGFSSDFEVARGRTGVTSGELAAKLAGAGALPPSTWVRMRREFAKGYWANVQYSMTRDEAGIAEVLVFRVRDPKEVMQVAISDTVTVTDPASVLAADTPAARIKIERFGKSSVGLTHCPGADQKAYQSLFRGASRTLSLYRDLLGARTGVPAEFARLGGGAPKSTAKPKKPAGTAPASPPDAAPAPKSKPQKP
ncbi:MAG: hypothetical protein M3P27_05325 [Acidobacteriota bacterium]|nr:hypothetical protein [Acidobacteriota bacterium]